MNDIDQFKRHLIRKIEALKHDLPETMNMEERCWKTRENDAYEKTIKIISETRQNDPRKEVRERHSG